MAGSGTQRKQPVGRREILRYGAVAGAAAVIGPVVPAMGIPAFADAGSAGGHTHVLPAPKPIAGGIQPPGGPLLHVFPAGSPDVTLPFSGLQLQGLDVDPSVITDYSGFTALAFHAGAAIGSDGARYNLETDMRAYQGTYIAADSSRTHGSFALV